MERSLHVISDAKGDPSSGVCTACNRRFIAKPRPGEDAMHWLTREFNDTIATPTPAKPLCGS
jgi:hypothetical protein